MPLQQILQQLSELMNVGPRIVAAVVSREQRRLEVAEDCLVGGDPHLFGRRAAMHDPGKMRMRQTGDQLREMGQSLAQRQLRREQFGERRPFDQPRRDIGEVLLRADCVVGQDAGVAQRGHRSGSLEQAWQVVEQTQQHRAIQRVLHRPIALHTRRL